MFAILVGVDKKNENTNFRFEQINEMKRVLDQLGFFTFEPLINENATKKNIDSKINQLKIKLRGETQEEEHSNYESLVIIFLSGNSIEKEENFNLFCPYDFDENNIFSTSIDILKLRDQLSNFNCKHTLFILDCPFSSNIFSDLCLSTLVFF